MIIYLATDHAGFELKEKVKDWLVKNGYEVKDFGAFSYDEKDDYPDFVKKAAEAVSERSASTPLSSGQAASATNDFLVPERSRGTTLNCAAIIFGGSGQGEAMVANRYTGVRAAVYYGEPSFAKASEGERSEPFNIIKLSREHNDANVLSFGARFIKEKDALKAVRLWLETPFSKEVRHQRRI